MGRRANLQKSERLPVRDAKASLTGKRPYYALASLPEGGVSDPLTGTPLRGESEPTKIRRRTRPPPLAGRVCVPHGANPSRQGRGTRSELASLTGRRNWPREGRQPVRDAGGPVPPGAGRVRPNSDSASEPTPPKGGSDDPLYI